MMPDLTIPIIGADDEMLRALGAQAPPVASTPSASVAKAAKGFSPIGAWSDQQRRNARYDVNVPMSCYQLLPSLEVDTTRRMAGVIENVGESGFGLNVLARDIRPGMQLLIAVETGESLKFIDVNILHRSETGGQATRLHTSASGPLQKLFLDDFVLPSLDLERFQYVLPFAESVFRSLSSIGATQRVVVDQVLVCPDCLGIPTLRRGCSVCLSHETQKSTMIHHFACANVDFVDRFDQGTEIACPKCLCRKMIIGADYEYLDGPVECRECGHENMDEILVGHCLRCSHRFPFDSAEITEIVGYRVNRLEPLALLNRN